MLFGLRPAAYLYVYYIFYYQAPGQCLRYFFGSTAYEIMIVKHDYGNSNGNGNGSGYGNSSGGHLKTRKSTHTQRLLRLANIKRTPWPSWRFQKDERTRIQLFAI